MTTYAKLEVNPDGYLMQSSYKVPSDGVLPNAQRASQTPDSLHTYSLTLFPRTATVALDGDENALRITRVLFPTHLRGRQHLLLLAPLAPPLVALYGFVGLLIQQNPLSLLALALTSLFVLGVTILLIGWPSYMWFNFLYYQGAPSYRVQRKVQDKYPDIPVFHDKESFLLDKLE